MWPLVGASPESLSCHAGWVQPLCPGPPKCPQNVLKVLQAAAPSAANPKIHQGIPDWDQTQNQGIVWVGRTFGTSLSEANPRICQGIPHWGQTQNQGMVWEKIWANPSICQRIPHWSQPWNQGMVWFGRTLGSQPQNLPRNSSLESETESRNGLGEPLGHLPVKPTPESIRESLTGVTQNQGMVWDNLWDTSQRSQPKNPPGNPSLESHRIRE